VRNGSFSQQCRSNPVSGRRLRKRIRRRLSAFWFRKPQELGPGDWCLIDGRSALVSLSASTRDFLSELHACLAEAGGFEFEMASWKSDALACPSEVAEPLSAEVNKWLQPFEFRETYRMDGVQSFGEKRAFRRTMGPALPIGRQSSNEKSLLLLGLFADEFTRRICSLGQAGGESVRLTLSS
jgi:hypothetical protein